MDKGQVLRSGILDTPLSLRVLLWRIITLNRSLTYEKARNLEHVSSVTLIPLPLHQLMLNDMILGILVKFNYEQVIK